MICYWLTCIHSGGKFFVPGSNRNTDFDNLGPLWASTRHPKQCRTFYGNDYAYRKVVYVASSKLSWFKNFQTVCEGEIWCLCTMTFGQKSLKLNSRPVYCHNLGHPKVHICIYRKVASSRPVYYSILNSLGQRSQKISIKFPLHKQSENAWVWRATNRDSLLLATLRYVINLDR